MPHDVDVSDLPPGWEWRGGEVSVDHYTTWFGTKYRMGGPLAGGKDRWLGGFDGQVYWDRGNDHVVQLLPIVGVSDDDPVFDYPEITRTFETAQAAHDAVPGCIAELEERA